MTLYRKKDTRQRRPLLGTIIFILAVYGLYREVQPYIEKTQWQLALALGIASLPVLGYQLWLWTPERMQRAYRFAREQHRLEQGRLTHREAKQSGLLLQGEGLPFASLSKRQQKRGERLIGLDSAEL
ncbi:MAG TPA: hypothetical protein ENJ56_07315, partial [Anaerolineae bacterium]|nr:hypothetical protein [Anaerolineae bacterium]